MAPENSHVGIFDYLSTKLMSSTVQESGTNPQMRYLLFQTTGEDRTPLENDLLVHAIDVTKNEERIRIIDANCKEVLPLNAQSTPTDNTAANEEEVIVEQANDDYCTVAATKFGHSNYKFTVDKKGILIKKFL